MVSGTCAIGIDLGGTKTAIGLVDGNGAVMRSLRRETNSGGGPSAVMDMIAGAVRELRKGAELNPVGIGVGVAGQIDAARGVVRFAPNLEWRNVSLGSALKEATGLPVAVTNDVRAAALGEWLFGAGKDCDDLLCVFVGTGIGGGIVAAGRMLGGCSNSAGEIGHITVDMKGPLCHCGKRGCLEALAGGWAIAQRAQDALILDPAGGAGLLGLAGGRVGNVTARLVAEAAHAGNSLAMKVMEEVAEALTAGAVSLVNALNPCRLILGGGVIQGAPELIGRIEEGVRYHALAAATESLKIMAASLGGDAGVVGAASLALQAFS